MSGQHTPGPWRAELTGAPEHDNQQWLILSEDWGTNDGDALICEMNDPHEATARLIASAPELLSALEALVERGTDSPQHRAAEAAIAKATGASS